MVLKRMIAVAGALAGFAFLMAGTASAGFIERHEDCTGDCYVKVHTAPVYAEVHKHILVKPAVAVSHPVPASYAVVQESVLVSPPQVVWTRKRDHHGREVMCRVVVPAKYGTVARRVMVTPPHHAYEVHAAQYVTETQTVKVRDGGSVWVPTGRRHRHWED